MSERTTRLAGAIVGFVAGAMVLGFVSGAAGFTLVKKAESDARAHWKLVQVLVAGRDLAPGTQITVDDVAVRAVPEQVVTASIIKPESASHIVRQKLTVPVREGDPLQWAFFVTGVPPGPGIEGLQIASGCAEAARRSRFAPPVETSDAEIRERLSRSR